MVEQLTLRLVVEFVGALDLVHIAHLRPVVETLADGRCLLTVTVRSPSEAAATEYLERRLQHSGATSITAAAAG